MSGAMGGPQGLAVSLTQVDKVYRKGHEQVSVLAGVDLTLAPGERVAVLGPSGSGKSTFLHLCGALDRPSRGEVRIGAHQVGKMSDAELARLRNRNVGFVFQAHNLLPEHDAVDNVGIPVRLAGGSAEVARVRAEALLRRVGLGHRLSHRPGELSGGEQQRVALARALVMGPGLVLADEPTGNLDARSAQAVFDVMLDLNTQLGSTLVVVTHSRELADRFPRRLLLCDGRFQDL